MKRRMSDAISRGLFSIQNYLDLELELETTREGKVTATGSLLNAIAESVEGLRFTARLSDLARKLGGAYKLRKVLSQLVEDESLFEYFAGQLGLEALDRAEHGATRFGRLVEVLPESAPPGRSLGFLQRVVTCYLHTYDEECIVMCRAVVEVLAETLAPERKGESLGRMIEALKDSKSISTTDAVDMHEINRQAREVIHQEPSHKPPDAEDCIKRLSRLLSRLHPAGWAFDGA